MVKLRCPTKLTKMLEMCIGQKTGEGEGSHLTRSLLVRGALILFDG